MATNPFALTIPPFAQGAQTMQASPAGDQQSGLWQRLQQEAQRRGITVQQLIQMLQQQQGGGQQGSSYGLQDLSNGTAQPGQQGPHNQAATWGQVGQNLLKTGQMIGRGIGPQMFLPYGSRGGGVPTARTATPAPPVSGGFVGSGAYTAEDVYQSPYDFGLQDLSQSPYYGGYGDPSQSPYDLGFA